MVRRMTKAEPIGIRLEPDERTALEEAAAADDRTMSALGRKIIAEWLRVNGWLKTAKPAPVAKQRSPKGR